MKILSLFDGISCARVALERAGIPVEAYYASEIDKYAIQVSQKNWSDIVPLGSVVNIVADCCAISRERDGVVVNIKNAFESFDLGKIDLLIGGSPCQDLSIAKKNRKGLDGERSGLFWEYVRILNEVKPKYFILENVNSMPKEAKELITKTLGVEPIMINASLVSAQNRKRLFWVGKRVGLTVLEGKPYYESVEMPQPEDRGILLKDILEEGEFHGLYSDYNNSTTYDKARTLGTGCGVTRSATCQQVITKPVRIAKIGKGGQGDRVYSVEGKSVNLSANGGGRGAKTGLYAVKDFVRKLTPVECERLQGLLDNYTEGISNTQRYKCLGNAFNVDVVAHILSFIPC